ncbi:uncharacterized protein LOC122947990 [Acropora millepora]|uniref:uncharacterized protein LOC122947990 n=1 Tax=Acropora millepora TaxID=45264 RepID=UPI001CF23527|nr:uncharacterized protein LOC122947990 [Acropora millepora]
MSQFKTSNKIKIAIGLFILVGLILLIVGIVLMAKSASKRNCQTNGSKGKHCDYSKEAMRAGVDDFLRKVQDKYFELHPQELLFKPGGVTLAQLQSNFKPYDPSPEVLRKITDSCRDLLKELDALGVSTAQLKPREKKSLAQVRHYLQNNFGTPYDGDYYAGDFLMGPNLFCWQPICGLGKYDIRYGIGNMRPKNLQDVKIVLEKIKLVENSFKKYIVNLKWGIKAGMVRSIEECKAGIDSFKQEYLKVSQGAAKGIFDETFMVPILHPSFLKGLKPGDLAKWENDHGRKTVNESLREHAEKYIGQPIYDVIRFLETENMRHCVPSSVSSGLAKLPLDYVYENGTRTNERTSKKLPLGEPLDGRKAYESIMPYFTTITKTPDEVHQLGKDMLDKLYPEVLAIARNVTGQQSNETAKEAFIQRLNQSDMFFNKIPFPANESDKNAHNLCSSIEGAKKFCPSRWATMETWFAEARKVMSMLDPKTIQMFHFNGPRHTTPNCPVDMLPDFNPSSGAQSYLRSTKDCTKSSYYRIPFFLSRPKIYEEWSVNAHEARPGHHTQSQGLVEHFGDSCGGVIGWLGEVTYYTAFSEGWALYAENPLIARDTDVYDNEPFQKFGMLKWQVWRALRLIVDTGLHYKNFTRDDALKFFADFAWDTSDSAKKEVTRYQSDPGQATAYMIGQLKIMELRDYATKELGDKFNLKDFHFYLLVQGSAPLSFLEESIREYVQCTKDSKLEGCYEVLNPVVPDEEKVTEFVGVIGEEMYEQPERLPIVSYM